jgi:transposase
MMYIGMDLHKNFVQIALMDNQGHLLQNARIENNTQQIDQFMNNLKGKNTKIVMESCNVWYNIYRHLKDKRLDVTLSNPLKTKAIASAKIKTDKVDARVLADLLRGGYIAECYVPDKRTLDLRELVRHRAFLVRTRAKMKNKVHGILLMDGIRITDAKKPFSKKYIEKLKELHNYRIDGYLRIIESLDSEIDNTSKMILAAAKEDSMARLLMSIPGVGYYSALLISSEIGDIDRFADSHHLCSYAGLVPSTYSSAATTYHGKITKMGSKYLRWALTECVHTHIRYQSNSNITKFYNRISKKKGTAKATVAAASKLLRVIYCILKERREYQPIIVKESTRGGALRNMPRYSNCETP